YEIFVQSVDEEGQVIDTTDAETVTITAPLASETFAIIFPADNADIIIGQLTIIGTSDPGLEIEILDGETVLGTTETAENGEWTFTLEPEEGSHVFSARLAGGDQSTDSRTVVVGTPAETDCDSNLGISRGDNYIVGSCNTFGTVIERTGATLESLIAANPQIDNPDLIFPGDILNIPAP
ncbi:MAG: LysM peptidoglycan-binding domain-containing protein, partial [Anaerolineae bacterium]|nr:LysM peptidoglycan-binding domain-containing protein [Anaerolineae bacterium]